MRKYIGIGEPSVRRVCGFALAAVGGVCLLLGAGCENARQGAVSGAAVGALSGLAIGSISGDAGKGAAIGAIVGGVGGGLIGDQNRRQRENAGAPAVGGGPVLAPVAAADLDRAGLARFAGWWSLSGWSEVVAADRRDLNGTAQGTVEQDYFLRLDVALAADEATGPRQTGTLLFGSEPGRGITLSSRFNDSPSTARFVGSGSADGSVMTLHEVDSIVPDMRRRVVIRFLSDAEWVADVSNVAESGSPRIGSFRFLRTR